MRGNTLVISTLAATSASASILPHLTGHDFDFTARYPSGLQFSTSDPPEDVLPAEEIALRRPVITLDNVDATAEDTRYISFLEISYYPTIDILDDVIYTFPWIIIAQVALENGTLSDDPDDTRRIYRADRIESGEVRNATMHVWKQTDELLSFLTEDEMPVFWQLASVWANVSSKAPYDFLRANIDLKTQNATGTCRGDVDQNGATISGFTETATATACSAAATSGSSILSSATAVDASATATSSAAGPMETPNASGLRLVASPIWSVIISCALIASSTIAMI